MVKGVWPINFDRYFNLFFYSGKFLGKWEGYSGVVFEVVLTTEKKGDLKSESENDVMGTIIIYVTTRNDFGEWIYAKVICPD